MGEFAYDYVGIDLAAATASTLTLTHAQRPRSHTITSACLGLQLYDVELAGGFGTHAFKTRIAKARTLV